jgi:hypothetical protein
MVAQQPIDNPEPTHPRLEDVITLMSNPSKEDVGLADKVYKSQKVPMKGSLVFPAHTSTHPQNIL